MKQEFDNTDWTQALRRRLQQAELPVEEKTWERVASRVDGKAEPAAAPSRSALARRLWPWVAVAAAAVVAALVVVPALLAPQPRRSAPAPATAIAAARPAPATVPAPSPAPVAVARPAAPRAHAARHRVIDVPQQPQAAQAPRQPQAPQQWAQAAARDSIVPVDTAQAATAREPLLASNEAGQGGWHNAAATATGAVSSSKWAGYGGLTAQVYGMGVMMASGGGMGRSLPPDAMTYNTMLLAASAAPSYDYKHKIPLMVGFTVGKMLDYGLEVTAGGSFSSYSSDVTNRLNGETFGQVVQLVGLPVGLRWHFASYKHLSAYVGAEGMVEWVTKAKFGSERVHAGRAQWSGSGMLGVQYSLADHVAIFVEPKFTHYFNRLPLKTVRSEHDINMNVRAGLSFDF